MEPDPAAPAGARAWLPRVEDWLLAGWVAFAAPVLSRLQGTTGDVLPSGRPLDGLLGVVALVGAAACLAARRPGAEAGDGPGFAASAAVGPFSGGLLFVAIATGTALGIDSVLGEVLVVLLVAGAVIVHLRAPAAPVGVRRLLVMPYLLVTGTLFWRLIDAVTGGGLLDQLRAMSMAELQANAAVIGFLVAGSAVYYAMLVMAPRQVAEREGGPASWALRYLLFLAGTAFGAAWLPALGG